jgi:hypothetical protein
MRLELQLVVVSFLASSIARGQAPPEPAWTGVAMPYYTSYGQSANQMTPSNTAPPPAVDFWFPTQYLTAPIDDELSSASGGLYSCTINGHTPPSPYWAGTTGSPIERTVPTVNTAFITPSGSGQAIRGFEFLGSFTTSLNDQATSTPPMTGSQAAVFYTNEPCYDGTSEYGFQQTFDVANDLVFYYGLLSNCTTGPTVCWADAALTQAEAGCDSGFTFIALPGSSQWNSTTGAYTYFYGAYVFQDTDGKYKFFVQVLDPTSGEPVVELNSPYLPYTCVVDPSLTDPSAACSSLRSYHQDLSNNPGGTACPANFPTSSFYYAAGTVTAKAGRNNTNPAPQAFTEAIAMEIDGFYVGK